MKTDAQLQQDVLAELRWEPSINAAHIGAQVSDGVVTLSGQVHRFSEKWGAERAAQRVAGVKGLAMDIEVALPGSDQRSDADIAHAAENVLQSTTYLPKDSVRVPVDNGWVTLSGEVDRDDAQKIVVDVHGAVITRSGTVHSWSERELARHSAWGTPGVRNVVDRMTVEA